MCGIKNGGDEVPSNSTSPMARLVEIGRRVFRSGGDGEFGEILTDSQPELFSLSTSMNALSIRDHEKCAG